MFCSIEIRSWLMKTGGRFPARLRARIGSQVAELDTHMNTAKAGKLVFDY